MFSAEESLARRPSPLILDPFGGSSHDGAAMWPSDDFGVVLWADAEGKRLRLSGQSAAAVRALLAAPGALALEVHADTPGVSLSAFLLWRNADGLACLRIDEHREHVGIDPTRSDKGGELWFPEGEGQAFPVRASEAIEGWQAAEALEHWLEVGGMWPGLMWS